MTKMQRDLASLWEETGVHHVFIPKEVRVACMHHHKLELPKFLPQVKWPKNSNRHNLAEVVAIKPQFAVITSPNAMAHRLPINRESNIAMERSWAVTAMTHCKQVVSIKIRKSIFNVLVEPSTNSYWNKNVEKQMAERMTFHKNETEEAEDQQRPLLLAGQPVPRPPQMVKLVPNHLVVEKGTVMSSAYSSTHSSVVDENGYYKGDYPQMSFADIVDCKLLRNRAGWLTFEANNVRTSTMVKAVHELHKKGIPSALLDGRVRFAAPEPLTKLKMEEIVKLTGAKFGYGDAPPRQPDMVAGVAAAEGEKLQKAVVKALKAPVTASEPITKFLVVGRQRGSCTHSLNEGDFIEWMKTNKFGRFLDIYDGLLKFCCPTADVRDKLIGTRAFINHAQVQFEPASFLLQELDEELEPDHPFLADVVAQADVDAPVRQLAV